MHRVILRIGPEDRTIIEVPFIERFIRRRIAVMPEFHVIDPGEDYSKPLMIRTKTALYELAGASTYQLVSLKDD